MAADWITRRLAGLLQRIWRKSEQLHRPLRRRLRRLDRHHLQLPKQMVQLQQQRRNQLLLLRRRNALFAPNQPRQPRPGTVGIQTEEPRMVAVLLPHQAKVAEDQVSPGDWQRL